MYLERVGSADMQRFPHLIDEIDRVLVSAYRTPSRRSRVERLLAGQPDGWVVARTSRNAGAPVAACGCFVAYPVSASLDVIRQSDPRLRSGSLDGGFGWIGLIATDPQAGRAGLGRAVTEWCIAELEARGCAPVLDASDQGAPLYARIGFEDRGFSAVYRHDGDKPHRPPTVDGPETRPVTDADLGTIFALDRLSFGADRSRLLTTLLTTHGHERFLVAVVRNEIVGYVCAQSDGIGPLVAQHDWAANELVRGALDLPWMQPPMMWVGPELQTSRDGANTMLEHLGFQHVRSLVRQHRGIGELPGRRGNLYAMASFAEG
jgi:ribosomal protein S18 acetylase RimI-like enzyme